MAPAKTTFHSKLLRVRRRGFDQTKDIANIDETPLPLVLDDGRLMQIKGAVKYVWYVSGSSDLDKSRQYLLMVYPAFVSLLYFVEKA